MTFGARAVLVALRDHASNLGGFEQVRAAEYRSAPPSGLCFAVWVEQLGSAPGGSGLSSTTGLLQLTAQIYHPAFAEPVEDIDLNVAGAADGYLGRLNGDLTLGGLVRNIDVLDEFGEPLVWKFGYVTIDAKVSRTATLPINIIKSDCWDQVISP